MIFFIQYTAALKQFMDFASSNAFIFSFSILSSLMIAYENRYNPLFS